MIPPPPRSTLFPYTTLFRSGRTTMLTRRGFALHSLHHRPIATLTCLGGMVAIGALALAFGLLDRKSTRLNSSHQIISYAVFCLKKKRAPRSGTPRGRWLARA